MTPNYTRSNLDIQYSYIIQYQDRVVLPFVFNEEEKEFSEKLLRQAEEQLNFKANDFNPPVFFVIKISRQTIIIKIDASERIINSLGMKQFVGNLQYNVNSFFRSPECRGVVDDNHSYCFLELSDFFENH